MDGALAKQKLRNSEQRQRYRPGRSRQAAREEKSDECVQANRRPVPPSGYTPAARQDMEDALLRG